MQQVAKGLRLIRGNDVESHFCGFELGLELNGDFDATLSYRDFQSQTEEKDWQIPRIELQFFIGGGGDDSDNTNVLYGGLRRQADRKLMIHTANRIRSSNGFDWNGRERVTQAAAGRLRFIRKGKTVYYLHSPADSDEWALLYEGPVSDAPLKGGNFGLRLEKPSSSGEIVLTEFTLKSREKQLNDGPQPYEFKDGELSKKLTWDFQGPKPSFLKLWGAAKPNRMEPVADGLKMVRAEKAGDDAIMCGFQWGTDVTGDFDKPTLSYRGLCVEDRRNRLADPLESKRILISAVAGDRR